MIGSFAFLSSLPEKEVPRELSILSLISQAFFQPLSLENNLLVILTALTSGAGVGFNRAMLLIRDGDRLKGEMWLGPRTPEEAAGIWEELSASGTGYAEMIEHNRRLVKGNGDSLTHRIKNLTFPIDRNNPSVPAMAAVRREMHLVRQPEPAVDRRFGEILAGTDEFLCIPLVAVDEVLGEIIVDNAITRKPITLADIRLAGICGILAGNHMVTDRLYRKFLDIQKMAGVGEVAVFMSHQLRNPLSAMGGFVEQLLRPDLPEEVRERDLRIIRDQVRRIENIMSGIGRYLKIERDEPVWFEPWPAIESVLAGPEIAARAALYDMRTTYEKKGGPEIYCDPGSFGEALRNILDNAFDATTPGCLIHIRAYPKKGGERFTVSVRDAGKGITEKDRTRLFQPSFSTKEQGMGMGLVFVKRIMDVCGGTIDFRSRPGKGTLMHLTFPGRLTRPSEVSP